MTSEQNQTILRAIIAALPEDTSPHGETPQPRHVYVPPSHIKALRLECGLVIGGRGVGKTFWSAALRSDLIRRMLGDSVPDLSRITVHTGYSEHPHLDAYPDADVFKSLLENGYEAYHIWRAVIARWLAEIVFGSMPQEKWIDSTKQIKDDPEQFGRLLERANNELGSRNEYGLIVFDALDRLGGDDWHRMDRIVRDLLRVVLSLKPFQRLHGKVFLREDQFAGRQVMDFTDASKLLATKVELTWGALDLHGLLWQYLCNAPEAHGETLRQLYNSTISDPPLRTIDGVWTLEEYVKRHEGVHRWLFAALAGKQMGRDHRRGVPYTWSVGHLADGRGHTSPRSFLAAIRAAAEDSQDRYPGHFHPLHYESIKRGVQKASAIRVSELAEDYPWVKTLMEPLGGVTVPCSFDTIEERWMEKLGESPQKIAFVSLPPEHYEEGWHGVRRDLDALGIFERMIDGRVNMPDLYRVGFGLGRRGGVRPIPKLGKE
ncbi:MAG: hypothetical protein M0006_00185 [Magnetospirillum sp.]|nr:hypothetical protein [Magnetospirillum sp.]